MQYSAIQCNAIQCNAMSGQQLCKLPQSWIMQWVGCATQVVPLNTAHHHIHHPQQHLRPSHPQQHPLPLSPLKRNQQSGPSFPKRTSLNSPPPKKKNIRGSSLRMVSLNIPWGWLLVILRVYLGVTQGSLNQWTSSGSGLSGVHFGHHHYRVMTVPMIIITGRQLAQFRRMQRQGGGGAFSKQPINYSSNSRPPLSTTFVYHHPIIRSSSDHPIIRSSYD